MKYGNFQYCGYRRRPGRRTIRKLPHLVGGIIKKLVIWHQPSPKKPQTPSIPVHVKVFKMTRAKSTLTCKVIIGLSRVPRAMTYTKQPIILVIQTNFRDEG